MKRTVLILFFCVLCMSVFQGCGLDGKVFVAVHYFQNDPANAPDVITSDITNLPAFASLTMGRYYETFPGTYNFQTTFGAANYPATFVLTAKSTPIGIENTYYDIVCLYDTTPVIAEFPNY
ncbi:MAG: hypothetical protein JW904_02640 [Spirochaetales bacterium]|nr:hypothetical protein [Spirochaetales bacterium]